MPAATELVAHDRSEEEIAETIGADWLIYQDLGDLINAVQKGNRSIVEFDCSCFNGKYVTRTINSEYLERVQNIRNDLAKQDVEDQVNVIGMDLHNNA